MFGGCVLIFNDGISIPILFPHGNPMEQEFFVPAITHREVKLLRTELKSAGTE
jgi:hypothetical protein